MRRERGKGFRKIHLSSFTFLTVNVRDQELNTKQVTMPAPHYCYKENKRNPYMERKKWKGKGLRIYIAIAGGRQQRKMEGERRD